MDKTQQRIKIAEACGWRLYSEKRGDCTLQYAYHKLKRHPKMASRNWEAQEHRYTDLEWSDFDRGLFWDLKQLPDYLNDLNAMHEAEKVLTLDQLLEYVEILRKSGGPVSRDHCPVTWIYAHVATAAQRAEAFLSTLGIWEENQND